MQALPVRDDRVVRHRADDLLDLGDRALAGLEDFERMLVGDVEGPLDLVVGDRMLEAVAQPRREYEQHGRQHDRRNHHQLQQANCRLPGGTHRASFHGSMTATIVIRAILHHCLPARTIEKISLPQCIIPFDLS